MTTPIRAALFAAGLAGLAAACSQQADQDPAITIENGWVRATPGGNDITAAYFSMVNAGGPDRLTAVDADGLDHVEMHRSSLQDGVMRMEPIDGLDVPANGEAGFVPGAEHLMLYGAGDLALGDTVCLSLTFQRSGERIACLPVLDDSPLD